MSNIQITELKTEHLNEIKTHEMREVVGGYSSVYDSYNYQVAHNYSDIFQLNLGGGYYYGGGNSAHVRQHASNSIY